MDSVKKIIIDNIKPAVTSGNGLVYNVPVDPYKAYEINMARYYDRVFQSKFGSAVLSLIPLPVA